VTDPASSKRVYFLANPDKPNVETTLKDLESFAASRCNVVGARADLDVNSAIEAQPDLIVLLGGDGSLIGVARSLGPNQVPIVGINVGKLGFLAEFSIKEFRNCLDLILTDPTLATRRAILETTIERRDGT
jgi:NAD+ kinase